MKKRVFLVFGVLFLFFILFSSCTVGDLYRNYKIKQYKNYVDEIFPTLDSSTASLVRNFRYELGPSYLGIIMDLIYLTPLAGTYVFDPSIREAIKQPLFSYLILAGIYDLNTITSYLDSPEEWFNKRIQSELRRQEELKKLKEKYGVWYEYVRERKIAIGMPKDIVIEILGKPNKINKTVTVSVIFEQWVYKKYDYKLQMDWPYLYLYFENGILISWQELD
jgi:hypothetical protein